MRKTRICLYAFFLPALTALPCLLPAISSFAQTPPASSASQEPGSDRFDFADGLYARGMYDMAAAEYNKLIREFPAHSRKADALFRLAESFFFLKNDAEALPLYEKFLLNYPLAKQREAAQLRSAEILERTQRDAEALKKLEPLTASETPLIRYAALYLKGKILLSAEKGTDAAEALEPLAAAPESEENPFHFIAHYYLGEIALKAKDLAGASRHFEEAGKSPKADLQQLASLGKGQSAALAGDFEKAQNAFYQTWHMNTEATVTQEAFYQYVRSLHEMKRYTDALAAMENLPPETPLSAALLFLKASSLSALEKHEEALNVFEHILSMPDITPEEKETAEIGKIETLLHLDRPQEGLAAARSMTPQRQFFKDRWTYLMAETLRRSGEAAEALKWLQIFIANFPDSPYRSQAVLNQGYILYESGDAAAARNAFDLFLQNNPDHAQAPATLKNRVTLDIKLGDWQSAIQTSLTFLAAFPEHPEAPEVESQLASLYLQTENYADAIRTFEAVLARNALPEKNGEIRFFLAYAYQLSENLEEAVKIYKTLPPEVLTTELYSAALKNTGYCLVRLEKMKEAAEAYRRWISEIPEADAGPEIFLWLADYEHRSKNADAVLEVMLTFQKKPAAAEFQNAIHFFLAEAYLLKENFETALEHYSLSLQENSEYRLRALRGQALAMAGLKRYDEAITNLEILLQEGSFDNNITLETRIELGRIYEAQERFLESAKAYFAAGILYDDPERVPDALFKAHAMFEKAEKPEEARKAYEELTSRFPDHPLTLTKQTPEPVEA